MAVGFAPGNWLCVYIFLTFVFIEQKLDHSILVRSSYPGEESRRPPPLPEVMSSLGTAPAGHAQCIQRPSVLWDRAGSAGSRALSHGDQWWPAAVRGQANSGARGQGGMQVGGRLWRNDVRERLVLWRPVAAEVFFCMCTAFGSVLENGHWIMVGGDWGPLTRVAAGVC